MILYLALALSLLFIFVVQIFYRTSATKKNLPPSPPRLPIIGHLHLQKLPMYVTYNKLAEKYGPIYTLEYGSRRVVVVSSASTIEECFTTKNDPILANRSFLLVGKYLGYNYTAIDHAPYGDHWRNMRRLAASEMLSISRMNSLVSIRNDEVKQMITKLSHESMQNFAKVELKTPFRDLAFNIMTRMTTGKRAFDDDLTTYYDSANPGDFISFWGWFDGGRYEKKLSNIFKRMDTWMQQLVEECRNKLHPGSLETLVNNLLLLQKSDPKNITDDTIKGFVSGIIFAGNEATYVTIEWAMASIVQDPRILKKLKDEMDNVIGQHRRLEEDDLPKLPYLRMVILEALRMFPATPMIDPHMASEDCTIAGYHIPRGSIILANAWALHRDPTLWKDPDTFVPERFEGISDGAIKNFIGFGMGRRSCPGMHLGHRIMGLTLGSIIQCFDWQMISGKDIDMTGASGVTMPMVVPLEVLCKARPIVKKILS
ncbi:hypothetical protein K2173_014747 [Erythroxylum novogranatense]|uniref:Cytochrome P450 n=1 Tax=Erythroxylum novogranatense TaxID=1862640 RepID=A0AAV8TFK7_9ROSI|nr:hypothetical protein K2173_014747 [Erythroxylum novogranatense]